MTLIIRSALFLAENTPKPVWRPGSAWTRWELTALPHTPYLHYGAGTSGGSGKEKEAKSEKEREGESRKEGGREEKGEGIDRNGNFFLFQSQSSSFIERRSDLRKLRSRVNDRISLQWCSYSPASYQVGVGRGPCATSTLCRSAMWRVPYRTCVVWETADPTELETRTKVIRRTTAKQKLK